MFVAAIGCLLVILLILLCIAVIVALTRISSNLADDWQNRNLLRAFWRSLQVDRCCGYNRGEDWIEAGQQIPTACCIPMPADEDDDEDEDVEEDAQACDARYMNYLGCKSYLIIANVLLLLLIIFAILLSYSSFMGSVYYVRSYVHFLQVQRCCRSRTKT